jgi:hypothetical protein
MEQSPVNLYAILAIIFLFVSIFGVLIFCAYRLVKRIYGKLKRITIEPANDADDNFGGYV